MLSKLKKKSIVHRFERDKLKSSLLTRKMNTNRVSSVAVLMEESQLDQKDRILKTIQKEFKIPLDNIGLLVFKTFSKETHFNDYECSEKDFGWFFSLKLNKLEEFVRNEYDLLINYGFQENLYWNVITLQSLSNFKVGFASKEDNLYDLSVSDDKRDIDILTSEAVKYLKILKKL